MEGPTPIWLDCDPGHDDMMAIILAAYDERVRLVGVSTVAGNQTLAKTTANARRVLALIGKEAIPVHEGAAHPLLRRFQKQCPEIHGDTGLDGCERLWELVPAQPEFPEGHANAVEAMRAAVLSNPEPLTLVATGPLTNVALLLATHPQLVNHIASIVVMGGSTESRGNTHPTAEYNIECDAEAAQMVFDADVPVVIVPLEVTHTALYTPDIQGRMTALASEHVVADILKDLLVFFADTYRDVFGFESPPLHDPTAVFYVCNPSAFEVSEHSCDVSLSGITRGQFVLDRFGMGPSKDRGENVTIADRMDVPLFWDTMLAAVEKAGNASSL